MWRNRVVNLTNETPEDLLANPANVRRHPGNQRDAMRGSLDELGWAAPVIVNDVTGHVLDGHLRIEEAITAGAPIIPTVHVALTEPEERLFLAVFDPIGALARNDQNRLDELIAALDTENPALIELLGSLCGEDIDDAPIHPPHPPKPGTSKSLVLIYDTDDYTELCAALTLLPGTTTADKVLRLVRNAIT
jgi:hypothetical protein